LLKRETMAGVLGAGVAISCILGSVFSARSSEKCGAPGILLVVFGALGALAFIGLLWHVRSRSVPARYSSWIVLGGILATAIVGVMSVLPWALLAGGLLLLAALLDVPRDPTGRIAALGLLSAGGLLAFIGLYQTTIRWGIDEVPVPAQSLVAESLSPIDYSDAFRVQVPTDATLDSAGRAEVLILSLRPCWVESPSREILDSLDPAVGSDLGHWPVYGSTENELVVGLDRSFIDLRLSLLMVHSDVERSVIVSTVARFNDWRGRLYFLPVRLAHRIVLADAMRRIQAYLRQ